VSQNRAAVHGFILIQPENNAMVSRELTAEEVVTYCGILSAIDSWEVRRPALTGSPPVGKGVPPPGGERGTSNVYVLESRTARRAGGIVLQKVNEADLTKNGVFFRVQS
jgi:hypothetical protein